MARLARTVSAPLIALGLPRAAVRPVLGAQALLLAALAAYAVHSIGGLGSGAAFEDWLYDGVLVGAAVLCLARGVLVRPQRAAWLVLGAGMASWSAGLVDVTLHPAVADGAFPSRADVMWLAFYPAAFAALVLLVRARVRHFYASLWVDGVVGACALAAVAAALAFPALVHDTGGNGSSVLADLSYPVADLLLAALVVWVSALTGWRPGRVLGVVGAGLLLGALADGFSLWWALSGHSSSQTPLDWLWPGSAVLLAVGAWQPQRPAPRMRLTGMRPLLPPVAFALSALGLLLYARVRPIDTAGFVLAGVTIAAAIFRMALTFAENARMAANSEREALTDPLTGLGNRRRLMAELQDLLTSAAASRPHALLVFDLDGFKRYNDTFGHPAGDALLARLGERLRDAVGAGGITCRLGGDEFCALVRLESRTLDEIADAACAALSERGRGFVVTTSCGAVTLPAEADEVSVALQVADERLYVHKGVRRSAREGQQTLQVLKQALHEREPDLYDHLDGVAALARPVGRRLGMTDAELDEMARAAELHDIGKIAVPDAILGKTGDLDALEEALMHQHTLVGERILGVAPTLRPVARIVRSSHEHFDGRGYPDGLAGEAIPLAARIIAVCDAYDAMTTDRPYSARTDHHSAITELRRCAGTQFDPRVVTVFCEEIEAGPRPREIHPRLLEAA